MILTLWGKGTGGGVDSNGLVTSGTGMKERRRWWLMSKEFVLSLGSGGVRGSTFRVFCSRDPQ